MARRSVCEAGQKRLWCCQYCDGDAVLEASAAGASEMYRTQTRFNDPSTPTRLMAFLRPRWSTT